MFRVSATIFCVAAVALSGNSAAFAQKEAKNMALKSGETLDLGPVYYQAKCSSIMTGLPVAEIMEGPAQISATVTPAMVLPRTQGCAKEIKGGRLSVTAKEVTEKAEGPLVIRVKYPTKDGEMQTTRFYHVVIYPPKS
jgi:hypothetical protein